MTSPINKEPFLVDFNSSDEDNAVWFMPPYCSAVTLRKIDFYPAEDRVVWVTDGDVELVGKMTFRVDRWVVVPLESYKNVSKDAKYYSVIANEHSKNALDDIDGMCKQCGHAFDPHLIVADPSNLSQDGVMRCPVDGCGCSNTISFDLH